MCIYKTFTELHSQRGRASWSNIARDGKIFQESFHFSVNITRKTFSSLEGDFSTPVLFYMIVDVNAMIAGTNKVNSVILKRESSSSSCDEIRWHVPNVAIFS